MTISFPEFPRQNLTPVRARPSFSGVALMPKKRRFGLYRNVVKRAVDLGAILVSAPVIVPVIAGLALWVARDGHAPFYSQMRVGKGGRAFRMWKLRSMVHDADLQMDALLARDPLARMEWESTQKLRQDPRITSFGRLLRRTSMDELPQLWNVFVGDMSLVGPRPMMLCQRDLYPGTAYYTLRPGITGYWQTEGRNSTTFEARAEFDTVYEESVALGTDLRILARTFSVVVNGTGC